jgi:5-formyltetrahydrofolate cyclo-ligase
MSAPDDSSTSGERAAIRAALRASRNRLPAGQRRRYALRVAARLARLPAFARARWIAGYLPFDGEMDPLPSMQRAGSAGKELCLPMIDPKGGRSMSLGHFRPGTVLLPNRFGILEPWRRMTVRVPLRRIDIVLVPLVGFDDRGNRLGMGAGYYDRFLRRRHLCLRRRPLLVGIGFDLQRVDRIARQPWDVAMDVIITERRVYRPRPVTQT